jgi:hypothetical protein
MSVVAVLLQICVSSNAGCLFFLVYADWAVVLGVCVLSSVCCPIHSGDEQTQNCLSVALWSSLC